MDYDIIKLLGIKDSGMKVLEVKESSKTRTVTIEKELCAHFCPACGFRMYSKGRETRTVNHPVMQDGLKLTRECEGISVNRNSCDLIGC